MADTKISALSAAATLTGAEIVPLVQSAGNVRSTVADIVAFGAWTQIGSTVATTSGTSVSFTSIPATYSDLLFEILGVSHDSGSNQSLRIELSPDGSTWATAFIVGASTANTVTWYGGLLIPGYLKAAGMASASIGNLASDSTTGGTSTNNGWRIVAGIQAVRFSPSAGNFDAGSIKLWGR